MIYTKSDTAVVKLTQSDPGFSFMDGLCIVQRAGLEISSDCPQKWVDVIATAMEKGWLKPVAYMKQEEHSWDTMRRQE